MGRWIQRISEAVGFAVNLTGLVSMVLGYCLIVGAVFVFGWVAAIILLIATFVVPALWGALVRDSWIIRLLATILLWPIGIYLVVAFLTSR